MVVMAYNRVTLVPYHYTYPVSVIYDLSPVTTLTLSTKTYVHQTYCTM